MRSAADSAPPPTAAEALRGAGLALLDAELLLAEVLGIERTALHLDRRRTLSAKEAEHFRGLVDRRRRGEPVAYILGRRGFRWIELHVDSRVLVPRPETETLVEAALDLPEGARVIDVGTGSGAVALALKSERPDLFVVGTDLSEDALAVARENGRRLALDVEWRHADLLKGLDGDWDAVVSNLPYVQNGAELPVDVREFEPPEALFGGEDGLDVIRRLVPAAAARAPFLALEVGEGQADRVCALCREAGFSSAEPRRDLSGVDLVVVARR